MKNLLPHLEQATEAYPCGLASKNPPAQAEL